MSQPPESAPRLQRLWRRSRMWAVARSHSLADLLYGPDEPPPVVPLRTRRPWPGRSHDALQPGQDGLAPSFDGIRHQLQGDAAEALAEALERWLDAHRVGQMPDWEPTLTARRLYNLGLELDQLRGRLQPVVEQRLLGHLAVTARYLAHNLEPERGGLELATQSRALVLAGRLVTGPEAREWLLLGVRTLEQQLAVELLADGGHRSRSPRLHAALLWVLLDVLNLVDASVATGLRPRARTMLAFVRHLARPDGGLPLLGRPAAQLSPRLDGLLEYGESLLDASLPAPGSSLVCFPHTGFAVLHLVESGCHDQLLVDWGPEQVPAQPGVAPLSVELSVDGLPWLGSDEPGDGGCGLELEPAAGRRAKGRWGGRDGLLWFEGSARRGASLHTRRVAALDERSWLLADELEPSQATRLRLRCQPGVQIDHPIDSASLLFLHQRGLELTLVPAEGTRLVKAEQRPAGGLIELAAGPGRTAALMLTRGHRRMSSLRARRSEGLLELLLRVDHHSRRLSWPSAAEPRVELERPADP